MLCNIYILTIKLVSTQVHHNTDHLNIKFLSNSVEWSRKEVLLKRQVSVCQQPDGKEETEE